MGGLGPMDISKQPPHLTILMTMARGPGQPKTGAATQSSRLSPWGRADTWLLKRGGHSPCHAVPLEQGGNSPFQTVPLV